MWGAHTPIQCLQTAPARAGVNREGGWLEISFHLPFFLSAPTHSYSYAACTGGCKFVLRERLTLAKQQPFVFFSLLRVQGTREQKGRNKVTKPASTHARTHGLASRRYGAHRSDQRTQELAIHTTSMCVCVFLSCCTCPLRTLLRP